MDPPVGLPPGFTWSTQALPQVLRAGRYALADRDFSYTYRGPSHALHLSLYHATIRFGDHAVALAPGDLTCSPAWGETRYHLPRPGFHWCIHFLPAPLSGESVTIPLHLPLRSFRAGATERFQRIAGLLAAPPGQAGLLHAAAAATLLELLLQLAAHAVPERSGERASRAAQAVVRAATIIEERLASPPSARALAELVSLSPNYLAHTFRQHYGMTMAGYLARVRMARAQELLRTTNMPIGHIAARIGMHDVQHLNKQFRRLLGCSPTAFRLRGQDEGSPDRA